MRLHSYYRSSTSYRVRIALNLKAISYEVVPIDILELENLSEDYRSRNLFGTVPCLEQAGIYRAQSMAVLEWLEDFQPAPALLPESIEDRFVVRELAFAIATELHAPLNLPVLQYLKSEFAAPQQAVDRWYHHWLERTLRPIENRLSQRATGDYLLGEPGLFEVVLVPQIYNARRFGFDLTPYPHLLRIERTCAMLPAFLDAHPDMQPDSPERSAK